jgi:predicted RNase H-like nuclease (RuvC/YqgF family)
MRYILTLIILVFLNTTSVAQIKWPWVKKPQPKPTPTQVEVKKDPATIGNARQIIKELNSELQKAKAQNVKLKDNLSRANTKILSAELETKKVQEAADKLKDWGIAQQSEKFKWMEKHEKLSKKYKLLKTIAVIIAAAAGVFLGLQFMALIPPPYNLAVPVGGAALFALLIGIFL